MSTTEAAKPAPPNSHPFLRSLAVALVLVVSLVTLVGVMTSAGAVQLGHVTFDVLFPGLLAALITAMEARRSRKTWPWWRYPLYIAPITLVLALLVVAVTSTQASGS
jgi:hypothetical protein